jgi:molecular chaperone GrpE
VKERVMMEQNASENTHDELDASALKKALEEEKAKAEANLAGWQRSQADFINYKRRVEQEREEMIKSANVGLVCNVLPVLDDMERAFASMPAHLAEDPWVNGIKLIERKLRSCLEVEGLCKIDALGESFDPHFHEAVRQDRGKEGEVIGEVLKGYKLNDRVIRPSKVIVGTGENGNQQVIDKGETKEE